MEKLFENKLNDDLKKKIFSMITYSPPIELLTQIKLYQDKKKYIDLFYNYVMTNWTYCYIDALSLIWKIYYLCIIEKADIIFKSEYHLNNCLGKYEKYVSYDTERIYTAELIRILNNSNNNIKNLLIKKYINKYIMVLKKHHLEFIDKELSIWGDITRYGYMDSSLDDYSIEYINKSYFIPAPLILNEYINFYID